MSMSSSDDFLRIGPRIRALPIIHGSGDYAVRVRADMLERSYDCLAVPLPPSFQDDVETAIQHLPAISAVLQRDAGPEAAGFSYVPIDPCQGVIAALRLALGEHIPRAFIDRETPYFEVQTGVFPDPYALKRVSAEGFAAAVLPAIPPPELGQHAERIAWMAHRLRELERRHRSILFVCSLLDWPWIRDAYLRRLPVEEPEEFDSTIQTFTVDPRTLIFLLGELPFITSLYEQAIRDLEPDENLSIDGVKEMVLAARDRLSETLPRVAQRITPQLLSIYFRYVRNLSLIHRRLTPDLYSLVVAAQQTAGDDFARAVAETARNYGFENDFLAEVLRDLVFSKEEHIVADDPPRRSLRMGIDEADVPGWGVAPMVSRLPGQALTWRSCELRPRPPERDRKRWQQRWNPYGQCSWPPEDDRIESFQQHVRDQAKTLIGADLARSEKFTTSVMDGLDMRETLRHWHTGDIYVKIIPPSRGSIEIVVFLFDAPADPRRYPFRTTWFAEHGEESTLAFFATDPLQDLVGPGIARAEYGGALFLFPPRAIPNIWDDPRLDIADTLEERLLAAALLHSRERHIAVVSPKPPPASWRRLARRYGRKIVHLPLRRFSGQTIERLRQFHILNGKEVRSYAAEFIRET
ncbi:MAG TPA: hypothetical protein VH575_27545 [Gemmataceae bacterium]|jgi:hypothetical protein